ncbi:MAG: hypothetical protein R3Y47_06990 [Lachnospiraceae bacterium]
MLIKNKKILQEYILHGFMVLYAISLFWLYYNQSIADFTQTEILYQSDLPLHISMIIEDGWYYSFTAYAYIVLYLLFGKTTIGIALLLTIVSVASVYATKRLLDVLFQEKQEDRCTLALAICLNFVMPIFISQVGEFRYVSYQSANIWHNSTYIMMKFFAIIVVQLYFKMMDTYGTTITCRNWITYMLLVVIATGIKPSFLVTFSPIVGFFLLYDLIHKTSWKQVLLFGSALLPAGIVILWQNLVLFGEDTGNGIVFDPWYTFSLHANIPKLAVVCSALFCGLVGVLTLKLLRKDRKYLFIVCMTILGFLQALCFTESGTRAVDGNFLWGYSLCLFFLFTVTAVKWIELQKNGGWKYIRIMLGAVFAWHLYCGIYFYLELLSGTTYFMR